MSSPATPIRVHSLTMGLPRNTSNRAPQQTAAASLERANSLQEFTISGPGKCHRVTISRPKQFTFRVGWLTFVHTQFSQIIQADAITIYANFQRGRSQEKIAFAVMVGGHDESLEQYAKPHDPRLTIHHPAGYNKDEEHKGITYGQRDSALQASTYWKKTLEAIDLLEEVRVHLELGMELVPVHVSKATELYSYLLHHIPVAPAAFENQDILHSLHLGILLNIHFICNEGTLDREHMAIELSSILSTWDEQKRAFETALETWESLSDAEYFGSPVEPQYAARPETPKSK